MEPGGAAGSHGGAAKREKNGKNGKKREFWGGSVKAGIPPEEKIPSGVKAGTQNSFKREKWKVGHSKFPQDKEREPKIPSEGRNEGVGLQNSLRRKK